MTASSNECPLGVGRTCKQYQVEHARHAHAQVTRETHHLKWLRTLCSFLVTMTTHGAHVSFVSASVGPSGVLGCGRELVWLRVLASLPAPLAGAFQTGQIEEYLYGSRVYGPSSTAPASSDAITSGRRTRSATHAKSPSSSMLGMMDELDVFSPLFTLLYYRQLISEFCVRIGSCLLD